MKFSKEQMNAPGTITDREWAAWYVENILAQVAPDQARANPPHINEEDTRNGLLYLRHWGIERRDLQMQVMNIMWGVAPNFFEHPAFGSILDRTDISEEEKVDLLYEVPDKEGGEAYMAADFRYWKPWMIKNNILGLEYDPEWDDPRWATEESGQDG